MYEYVEWLCVLFGLCMFVVCLFGFDGIWVDYYLCCFICYGLV